MKIYMGEARHDENGKITGGVAGDQTKDEVMVAEYRNEFTKIYRAKDKLKAVGIAESMLDACGNDNIGYSQGSETGSGRYSLWLQMQKGKKIADVSVPCATDCSQLVADICIENGINISPYMTTRNEHDILMQTGLFDCYDLTDLSQLKIGDIVWRTGHTAVVVMIDSEPSKTPKFVGVATARTTVYEEPSKTSRPHPSWNSLGVGNLVEVCDEVAGFYYILIAGKYYGYVPVSAMAHADGQGKPIKDEDLPKVEAPKEETPKEETKIEIVAKPKKEFAVGEIYKVTEVTDKQVTLVRMTESDIVTEFVL